MRQQYARLFTNWLIGVAVLLCVSTSVQAAPFEIKSVDSDLRSGIYHINARFDLKLSEDMQAALLNGVALVIAVEIELNRPRRYWMDADIATLVQRYALSYHALSRQYLVVDLNTEIQRSFHDLNAAIDFLNSGSELPTVDADLLNPDLAYLAYIRVFLVRSELPIALKVKAYSLRGWKAASRWVMWQIQ